MERTAAEQTFFDALEGSFLPDEEKQALAVSAASGVTPALWNEFNDRLIAAIVRTRERQRESGEGLDEEINRFTLAYEKEKSVRDYELRAALAKIGPDDQAARDLLWEEYGVDIRRLQDKLLADVRNTSTSVLHDVILAVVPGAAKRWSAAEE